MNSPIKFCEGPLLPLPPVPLLMVSVQLCVQESTCIQINMSVPFVGHSINVLAHALLAQV